MTQTFYAHINKRKKTIYPTSKLKKKKKPHKHNAEVLSGVSKHKKFIMCFTKEIHLLNKLSTGMSYSAIGHEFNANKLMTYIK
jgi:hypothetical protein